MALPTRHFKIGFSGIQIIGGIKYYNDESLGYGLVGLFKFLQRGMKFSYDYVIDSSHSGGRLSNGTWTGIFGLANQSKIDYAPVTSFIIDESWDVVAHNYPYACDEITFVTRKQAYSPEIMALFQTLSLNVWLSLLACIILVTLVCFVAIKHRCTLDDILLHVLAIGLNQEGNLVPKRVGEILLLCTWAVAMAVFTFCFKSVLLSFLAFPPQSGVRTVPELAAAIRASQYGAFTTSGNEFIQLNLRRSPVEDHKVIGENIFKNPYGPLDFDVIRQSPEYPTWAFVYMRSPLDVFDERVHVSEDNMLTLWIATFVSKDFCCKDEMDMLIHRFHATGIQQKHRLLNLYKGKWYFKNNIKPHDGEKTRKISMTDISGALILLVAGHCLSVCVLIVECWVKHREKRRTHLLSTQTQRPTAQSTEEMPGAPFEPPSSFPV